MKPNELTVGDWVRVPFGLPEIRQVKYPSEIDDADFYEPIRLTGEILEKNGFVGGQIRVFTTPFLRQRIWCKVEVYEYQPIRGVKQINAFRLMIGGKEHSGVDIHINYVHELQHALRLCGIDKTIEL